MVIPKYTHQQFAVMDILEKEGVLWGRELRSYLKALGYGSNGASFLEFMIRLEKAGLVEGWYEEPDALGQLAEERSYQLTTSGRSAREEVALYYATRPGARLQQGR